MVNSHHDLDMHCLPYRADHWTSDLLQKNEDNLSNISVSLDIYLTIRKQACVVYEQIVNEAQPSYTYISTTRASCIIVLV